MNNAEIFSSTIELSGSLSQMTTIAGGSITFGDTNTGGPTSFRMYGSSFSAAGLDHGSTSAGSFSCSFINSEIVNSQISLDSTLLPNASSTSYTLSVNNTDMRSSSLILSDCDYRNSNNVEISLNTLISKGLEGRTTLTGSIIDLSSIASVGALKLDEINFDFVSSTIIDSLVTFEGSEYDMPLPGHSIIIDSNLHESTIDFTECSFTSNRNSLDNSIEIVGDFRSSTIDFLSGGSFNSTSSASAIIVLGTASEEVYFETSSFSNTGGTVSLSDCSVNLSSCQVKYSNLLIQNGISFSGKSWDISDTTFKRITQFILAVLTNVIIYRVNECDFSDHAKLRLADTSASYNAATLKRITIDKYNFMMNIQIAGFTASAGVPKNTAYFVPYLTIMQEIIPGPTLTFGSGPLASPVDLRLSTSGTFSNNINENVFDASSTLPTPANAIAVSSNSIMEEVLVTFPSPVTAGTLSLILKGRIVL